MPADTNRQIEAIHSMLTAGHRSIRMARHSLILWGLAGGMLVVFTDWVISEERFPVHWQRAVAEFAWLGLVLSMVGIVDYHYTRENVRARGETISFTHAQVIKVWWLLIAMGVLITFGMHFFGGGYMVYGMWLVLLGIGLYVHGLFSEQMLEWVGVIMILLGIVPLAFKLPFEAIKWLTAAVLGIGMPVLSLMLDGGQSRRVIRRLAQSVLWLTVVLAPAAVAYQYIQSVQWVNAPVVSLEKYLQQQAAAGEQIVVLPAGTVVPLRIEIEGNVLQADQALSMPLVLLQPLEVVAVDDKLDGRFRLSDGSRVYRRSSLRITVTEMQASLSPTTGPVVKTRLDVDVGD